MINLRIGLIFLFFFLSSIDSYAQSDTIRLYYAIDQKELANKTSRLDTLLIISKGVEKISVIGYADYLGTSDYNIRLSLKRADIAKEYIKKILPNILIESEGRGEVPSVTNEIPLGEVLNRRVDIIVRSRIHKDTSTFVRNDRINSIKKPEKIIGKPLKQEKQVDAVQRILSLSNLKPGESISLEELTFQPGRHFLLPEAVPYVDTLLKTLKKHRNLKVEIRGYICCDYENSDGYDLDQKDYTLSVNRAKFIYDYLVNKGISSKRMNYIGLGNSNPKVFPELTIEDKVRNRRVEIVVLEQ